MWKGQAYIFQPIFYFSLREYRSVVSIAAMSGRSFGGSPEDAVRATASLTDSVRDQLNAARKNPEKELGMPFDELERRQKEARKPRTYTNDASRRSFEVRSSARAQQVMNQGIDKYQREKRQRDLKNTMSMLRKFQILLSVFGVGFFVWLGATYLLPQYAAVQNRNQRMQLRYERAQKKWEELQSTPSQNGNSDAAPDGAAAMVRVFRIPADTTEKTIH